VTIESTPGTLTVTKAGTGSGTVTSSPPGINCGTDCTENYLFGTVVTLTPTPDSGSGVTQWSGDPDCTDGSVTMEASKSCIATFNLIGGPSTEPIHVSSSGAQANDRQLGWGFLSPDGQYAVFSSLATNLVSGDTNGVGDVFVHNLQTSNTQRVSERSSGVQGNDVSRNPVISADNRWVSFPSRASNLVSGDTNGASDIFVKDLQTEAIVRVSVTSSGVEGDSDSFRPSISGDGRYVAFRSFATNLDGLINSNGVWDIFLHDRDPDTNGIYDEGNGTTVRVTDGNGHSNKPVISQDGRYIAYPSDANNLVPGDSNGVKDVYVYSRVTGITTIASVNSSGVQGNGHTRNPSISSDGRYIAYPSQATNLVSNDTNGLSDAFVHDRDVDGDGNFDETGAISTTRVSVQSGGAQANGDCRNPSISGTGRFVSFHCFGVDLVPGDTNGVGDVIIHDRNTSTTERVSLADDGSQSNGHSYKSMPSDDGRYVSFSSEASNLVPGDTNGVLDLFVRDRGTP